MEAFVERMLRLVLWTCFMFESFQTILIGMEKDMTSMEMLTKTYQKLFHAAWLISEACIVCGYCRRLTTRKKVKVKRALHAEQAVSQ